MKYNLIYLHKINQCLLELYINIYAVMCICYFVIDYVIKKRRAVKFCLSYNFPSREAIHEIIHNTTKERFKV